MRASSYEPISSVSGAVPGTDVNLSWLGQADFWLCLLRILIILEIIKMEPK